MANFKKTILRECLRIAREKNKFNLEQSFLHHTFIIQHNKIIEYAVNRTHVPPVHFGYARKISGALPKLHAEVSAYRRAKALIKGAFVCVNIRLNRAGKLKLSAPCECCARLLAAFGCRHVWFTTDAGWAQMRLDKIL